MGTRSGGIDTNVVLRLVEDKGLDVIAFTGGIGENALGVHTRILRGLEWTGVRMYPDANHRNDVGLAAESSKVKAWVIPAKEVKMIVAYASTLMGAR